MYSSSQNRNKKKPASQSIKKQRPRPEWTTDFVDRQQFKLSQTQMIQKKAALQSKHRQEAKRQLQQRRKKLQMGIIDDQTRKVYQTALTSKNIDINPPIRKNLTEMIRYEKQQKQKRISNQQDQDQQFYDSQDEENQYEKEIREAQNFIKKFQKAKKQEKIQRAVQILSNNRSQVVDKEKRIGQNSSNSETRINNFMNVSGSQNSRNEKSLKKQKGSQQSQSFSRDDALTSIEDTIKFMQQKLFAAKRTVEEHSKSCISEQSSQDQSRFYQKKRNEFSDDDEEKIIVNKKPVFKKAKKFQQKQKQYQEEINFNTKAQNILQNDEELQFNERIAQISQLRIKLKDEDASSQDDECLNTIRRMRELMDNKQSDNDDNEKKYSQMLKENIRDNQFTPSIESLGWNSTIYKKGNQSYLESEAQVSFSLTNNNDDQYQQESSLLNLSKSKIKNNDFGLKKEDNFMKQNNNLKQVGNFNKQKSKEDEYEDQYQKIKQNLFDCINSSGDSDIKFIPKKQNSYKPQQKKIFQKFRQDSDQESEDSLMVRDKINLWKQELKHQAQPQDDDDQHQNERQYQNSNVNLKTTYMNSKPKFIKQCQEDEDQEDDDSAYKYNYFQQTTQPITQFNNRFQPEETTSTFSNTNNSHNTLMMKKPPNPKKTQNNQKFEEMKKMLSNTTNEIQKIEIQPLKIQPLSGNGQMLGFDFRGSINIKKNVLSK